jgi:hypothetical protein
MYKEGKKSIAGKKTTAHTTLVRNPIFLDDMSTAPPRKRRRAQKFDPTLADDLHRAIAASLRPTDSHSASDDGAESDDDDESPTTHSALVVRIPRRLLPRSVLAALAMQIPTTQPLQRRAERSRKGGKSALLSMEPFIGTASIQEPGGGTTQRWTAHIATDMETKQHVGRVEAGRATACRPSGGYIRVAGTYNTLVEAALAHDAVALTTLGSDATTNFGFLTTLKAYKGKLDISKSILARTHGTGGG